MGDVATGLWQTDNTGMNVSDGMEPRSYQSTDLTKKKKKVSDISDSTPFEICLFFS